MKYFLLAFMLIPVMSFAQKEIPVKIKETNHGMYTGTTVGSYSNSTSPSGGGTEMIGVLFFPITDTIVMAKGNKFGIEFIVESTKFRYVDIEVVWTFPSVIIDNDGKEFTELRSTRTRWVNEKTFTGYHFDENYELVPGTWRLQMFYKNELIHEHIFFVQ